jgi:hypothetical protein
MPAFTFDETSPAPTPAADSLYVNNLHDFPRGPYSAAFDINDAEYQHGCAFIFATVIAVAVLLILIYVFFLFARCCCKCCQISDASMRNHEARCGATGQRMCLFLWLLLTMVLMCCSYIGRNEFIEGVERLTDASDSLGDIFSELNTQGDLLVDAASDLNTTIAGISCESPGDDDPVAEFAGYATAFLTAVNALNDMWDGLDTKFYDIGEVFEERGPQFVDMGVMAIVMLVGFVCVIGVLADLLSNCPGGWLLFNLASLIGILVMLILTVIIALELTMSVVISDFCSAGIDQSFLDVMQNDIGLEDETLKLVTYYVSCGGVNPLFSAMNASIIELEGLNATAHETAQIEYGGVKVCTPTADVKELGTISVDSLGTLDDIQGTIGCGEINPIYQTVTHELLCINLVQARRRARLFFFWFRIQHAFRAPPGPASRGVSGSRHDHGGRQTRGGFFLNERLHVMAPRASATPLRAGPLLAVDRPGRRRDHALHRSLRHLVHQGKGHDREAPRRGRSRGRQEGPQSHLSAQRPTSERKGRRRAPSPTAAPPRLPSPRGARPARARLVCAATAPSADVVAASRGASTRPRALNVYACRSRITIWCSHRTTAMAPGPRGPRNVDSTKLLRTKLRQ